MNSLSSGKGIVPIVIPVVMVTECLKQFPTTAPFSNTSGGGERKKVFCQILRRLVWSKLIIKGSIAGGTIFQQLNVVIERAFRHCCFASLAGPFPGKKEVVQRAHHNIISATTVPVVDYVVYVWVRMMGNSFLIWRASADPRNEQGKHRKRDDATLGTRIPVMRFQFPVIDIFLR